MMGPNPVVNRACWGSASQILPNLTIPLDEHVQAHEQPEGVLRPIVVDDGFVNNQGASLGQRVMGFLEERQLLLDVPIVKDVPHDEDVRRRERVWCEKAAEIGESSRQGRSWPLFTK